ncbi:MAG: hypothetical protein FGM54_05105 [Chitinophagaceae bacterium]|nr:hypothetical protein [Chitinophagaceae bacterium]
MKSIILRLSVLISACLMACNSTQNTSNTWTELAIPKLKCTVAYPQHWQVAVTGSDSSQYSFLADMIDSNATFSTRISLRNEKMPFALNAADYNQGMITMIQLSNPGLQVYPLPVDTVDKNQYHGYTFQFQDKDSTRYSVYGYTLLRDSLAYAINMTCESDKAKPYADTLKQFLQKIRFNP